MNHNSVQFRSKEERQRDEEICNKYGRLAMPAIQAAYALPKAAQKSPTLEGRNPDEFAG